MAKIKPGKRRATISEGAKGLEIIIPSKKNIFIILFLSVWLVGWALGEIMVPRELFSDKPDDASKIFLVVWLVVWTIGGIFAIYIWLWNLTGKEIISVNSLSITVKRSLFGYGREKEYEMTHINNLRVSPQPFNPWNFSSGLQCWGIGGGVIAFDYGARTYRFGSGIDEAEATQLLEKIKERYSL